MRDITEKDKLIEALAKETSHIVGDAYFQELKDYLNKKGGK